MGLVEQGWTLKSIAREASLIRARGTDRNASEAQLLDTATRKGVSVSLAAVGHYKTSWEGLADAAIPIDADTFWIAYNLTFEGAARRRDVLATVSGRQPSDRRESFVAVGRAAIGSKKSLTTIDDIPMSQDTLAVLQATADRRGLTLNDYMLEIIGREVKRIRAEQAKRSRSNAAPE